eukprot:NODE_423_length_8874_cov_0.432023.p1 type:complete len:514 gc:universal NODE_423_length_8874_cov_0.432023:4821-3280(-)
MSKYTVDVGNGVMRSPLSKDKLIENSEHGYYDLFLKALEITEDGNYLGTLDLKTEQYQWLKYSQVREIVAKVGSALLHLTGKKANIGIYSLNRKEWTITELGCFRNNLITVPLYDTLGKEAIVHIINETEMSLCVLSRNRIQGIIDAKKEGVLKPLEIIVSMDDAEDSLKSAAQSVGLRLLSWEEFLKIGSDNNTDESGKSTNADIFTICYTSGTSGMPKGVVLTHKNVLSIAACLEFMGKNGTFYKLSKNDVHLSYLPLAHVFERVLQAYLLDSGSQVAFYRGDPLKILDDVKIIKPTIFVSVPRLFNRIYDKVWQGVNEKSAIAKFLFKLAFSQKKMGLGEGKVTHWLWDKLVFGGVKERLGFGRCQMMFSGSAPITADVMDFLRIVFCCEALEGFGQTESTAGVAVTHWGDTTSGHIGGPIPCVEIKLMDLPEMQYTSKDKPNPRGEICYRGSNAFVEYYKAPQKTSETIDSEGWVHTGDVGLWDDLGRLRIIDRAKNIFKLAQGYTLLI